MVGIQDRKKMVYHPNKSDTTLAEEFNQFYVRFDCHDFSKELCKFREAPEGSMIQIDEIDVWRILEETDPRESSRPDGISDC